MPSPELGDEVELESVGLDEPTRNEEQVCARQRPQPEIPGTSVVTQETSRRGGRAREIPARFKDFAM